MKGNFASLLIVLVTALAAATPSLQAKTSHCSAASAAGLWAYTYTGTAYSAEGPVADASVGHFHQDAAGNVTGSQTHNLGGAWEVEDISGSITTSRDCTATGTISVFVGGVLQRTATLAGVYDSDMNHIRYIFETLTLPDGTVLPVVITIDGNRLRPAD